MNDIELQQQTLSNLQSELLSLHELSVDLSLQQSEANIRLSVLDKQVMCLDV